MTTIMYRGRKRQRPVTTTHTAPKTAPTLPADRPQLHERIRAKQIADVNTHRKGKGERMREIKHMQGTSAEGRITRLMQLAAEFGPDKLEQEIAVHERKAEELREALRRLAKT